ncbi:exosortase system-associated protein, TIGR04073 family [Candidatus Omnitrophota bacterium]
MKKLLIIALLVSFVIGTVSMSALAVEEGKAKRGAKNTLLGWTEIPKTIMQVTKDTDNPFLGITVGLLKGIANTFARTTSGMADLVTLPSGESEPLMKETMVEVGSETK